MAVSSTFKQQCPSCEAMISIKENMIGKKVECTKCKDKFLAERPDAEEKDRGQEQEIGRQKSLRRPWPASLPPARRRKKSTMRATKCPPPRPANPKPPPTANRPQNPPRKTMTTTTTNPPKKRQDPLQQARHRAGAGGRRRTAARCFCHLRFAGSLHDEGRQRNQGRIQGTQGGGPKPNEGDKTNTPIIPVDPGPQTPKTIPLDEKELARLSNLLPNDSEHVFHAFFRDLFGAKTALREAGVLHDSVFETPAPSMTRRS